MPAAMSRFRRISNRGTGCLNMFKCLLLASIFSVTLRVICTFVSPLKRESDIPVSSSSSSSALLLASSEWSLDHWRGQSALASYVLWQTYKTSNRSSIPHQAHEPMATWTDLNSDLDTQLVGDVEAEAFINLTFTREVSETYRKLPLGVMRADFWRYAVLYARGGIYADVDATCVVPIRNWLPPMDRAGEDLALETEYNNMTWDQCSILIAMENDLHFCQHGPLLPCLATSCPTPTHSFTQWAFASAPRHPLLHHVLRMIMERVEMTDGINTSFDAFVHHYTGPGVWTDAIISFLNLPGISSAKDALVRIFSDRKAYAQAHKYGLCLVGEDFFRAINVNNLFASEGFTDGWESWTEQRNKFFPSPPSPLPDPPNLPGAVRIQPVQFQKFFFQEAVSRAKARRARREHHLPLNKN